MVAVVINRTRLPASKFLVHLSTLRTIKASASRTASGVKAFASINDLSERLGDPFQERDRIISNYFHKQSF